MANYDVTQVLDFEPTNNILCRDQIPGCGDVITAILTARAVMISPQDRTYLGSVVGVGNVIARIPDSN